ncbi:MAG TPA: EAL domain-containing protein [Solirubrobacteraceae bacterium]|nr:EAL domain-containing protein [Solirubrobacteraceae bacterium]
MLGETHSSGLPLGGIAEALSAEIAGWCAVGLLARRPRGTALELSYADGGAGDEPRDRPGSEQRRRDLIEQVLDTNAPLRIGQSPGGYDPTEDGQLLGHLAALDSEAILAAPIRCQGVAVGAILVGRRSDAGALGDAAVSTLEAVAALIGRQLEPAPPESSPAGAGDPSLATERRASVVADQLVQAVEVAPLPMCLVGSDDRFLCVSDSLATVLGRTPEEMLDLTVLDATHPDDRDRMVAMMGLIRSGAVRSPKFEKRCLHSSGETIPSLVSGALVRDVSGRPQCIAFFVERSPEPGYLADEEHWRELQDALDQATGGIALIAPDGSYVRVNDAYARILGYEPQEMHGISWRQTVGAAGMAEAEAAYAEMVKTGRACIETTGVRKDGSRVEKDVELVINRALDGTVRGHFCFAWDITERKDAERRAAALLSLSRLALARTDLGSLIDQATETVRSALWVSHSAVFKSQPEAAELLLCAGRGWSAGHVGSATVALLPETHVGYVLLSAEPVVFEELSAKSPFKGCSLLEVHAVRSGAAVRIGDPAVPVGVLGVYTQAPRVFSHDEVGFLEMVAAIITSAAERERAENEIRYHALHDPVTGLSNRAHFHGRLEHALGTPTNASALPAAILLIDLGGVRRVRRALGHETADAMTTECAARLAPLLDSSDVLARIDEGTLALLLIGARHRHALSTARKILAALSEPFVLAEGEHFIAPTIGVSVTKGKARNPDKLLAEADVARQRAAAAGPGRYELFDSGVHRELLMGLQLEKDLASAIGRLELELHYQPIIDLAERRVVGAEALLRWRHPIRGLLPPGMFIPVAEESGLIVPIGAWVMEQAALQLGRWNAARPDGPPLAMHINVAAAQFADGGLADIVTRAIELTGIAPAQLCLELTETTLMVELQSTDQILASLQKLGVSLFLDDFGTGYSSLSYLKRFPITAVKIDRSFIAGLEVSSQDRAIVAAVLGMAHATGLGVIAEGVETEEQAAALTDLGCPHAQGFLFSRPLPPAEIEGLLIEGRLGAR